MSDCTVVMNARDQFSCTGAFLRLIREHTPKGVPMLALIGGAPEHLKDQWQRDHGDRIEFVFKDRYLNQAEARNEALRMVKTPLSAVIDNDCFTRPGWLEPLLECYRETGAGLVVPLILERPRRIHCVGCDLYVTTDNGKPFAHKVLRFHGFPYGESCNLERKETDYGEMHCMLVETEQALELEIFDENIREGGEVDSGLVLSKAGRSMWVEPKSVVHFVEDAPLHGDDIGFYTWRWDMEGVLEGYRHFECKWDLDMTEHGNFRTFLYARNKRIGLMTRVLPSKRVKALEDTVAGAVWKARRLLRIPDDAWFKLRARQLGYGVWPTFPEAELNEASGHPDLR